MICMLCGVVALSKSKSEFVQEESIILYLLFSDRLVHFLVRQFRLVS